MKDPAGKGNNEIQFDFSAESDKSRIEYPHQAIPPRSQMNRHNLTTTTNTKRQKRISKTEMMCNFTCPGHLYRVRAPYYDLMHKLGARKNLCPASAVQ